LHVPIVLSHTENQDSAIADKPHDAFVQTQWRGDLLTRPSPYVLPCRIWSFCIKRCRHEYRRAHKIRERWNFAILGWEV